MADLGEIAQSARSVRYNRPLPVWRNIGEASEAFTIDMSGSLSGVVNKLGSPEAGAIVSLYYSPTGRLIARMTTGATGAFSFDGLDVSDDGYYIVAQVAGSYNAMIYHQLQPI